VALGGQTIFFQVLKQQNLHILIYMWVK